MTLLHPTRRFVCICVLGAYWILTPDRLACGQAPAAAEPPADAAPAEDPFGLEPDGALAEDAPGEESPLTQEEVEKQYQDARAAVEKSMGEKKWSEALEQLEKMLSMSQGRDPSVYLQMGACYRELGKRNEALDSFTQVILNPASVQDRALMASANLSRGGVYIDLGRYREAVDDLEQAVAADPSNLQALYLLGKARLRLVSSLPGAGRDEAGQRDLQSALESLKQAIELKSDFGEAYLERGRVLVRLGSLDFAVEDLQQAVKLLGPGTVASVDLGSALLNRANQESADPNGSSDKIVADLRAGLKSLNEFVGRSQLGVKQAPWELTDPLDDYPAEAALLQRAQALIGLADETSGDGRRGLYEAAVRDCKLLLDGDPEVLQKARAYLLLGQAMRMMNDLPAAIDAYSRSIQSLPQPMLMQYIGTEPYLRRGICYFHLGEYGEALQDFEMAASNNPTNPFQHEPRAMFWAGLAQARLGEQEEAIYHYSRAIGSSPDYTPAYLNRGLAYLNTGRYERAIEDFNHVLRRDARHTQALHYRQLAEQRRPQTGG